MKGIDLWAPVGAKHIINKLRARGFEAYVVGGCVRDTVMGCGGMVHDWDICTSAKPVEILKCFEEYDVVETGARYGTISVFIYGVQFEVTTFRTDGGYSDGRHPDNVRFTGDIIDDLSRRDFTMNAMAYGPDGLIDPFGGYRDISDGVIRCVGAPMDRFSEDALRVLRALRFSSVLGFKIDHNTAGAIHKSCEKLKNVSAERIRSELCKMLAGRQVLEVLLEYSDVMAAIIPEFTPCIGFDQKNKYHEYTVYDHISHAVANYRGGDESVRLALLLHDIGKPQCYTEDENGGHFHGHGGPSRDIAEVVMDRLRFDNRTKREVLELVLYHDAVIEPNVKTVKRWLNRIGERRMSQLLQVRMADILAHKKDTQQSRIDRCVKLRDTMNEVLRSQQCFKVKDLAINGHDVMALGVEQGRLVGAVLQHVLDLVIGGKIQNNAKEETEAAAAFISKIRWHESAEDV